MLAPCLQATTRLRCRRQPRLTRPPTNSSSTPPRPWARSETGLGMALWHSSGVGRQGFRCGMPTSPAAHPAACRGAALHALQLHGRLPPSHAMPCQHLAIPSKPSPLFAHLFQILDHQQCSARPRKPVQPHAGPFLHVAPRTGVRRRPPVPASLRPTPAPPLRACCALACSGRWCLRSC